jgi:hypothetical protein
MLKPHYAFEKTKKEQAKKKQREEKRDKKPARRTDEIREEKGAVAESVE